MNNIFQQEACVNNSSTASTTGASPVVFTGSVPSVFSNEEFGSVRVIVKDNGEPLFCGKDVATCLGYADPSNAVCTRVDDEDKTTLVICQCDSSERTSRTTFINESGLYSLVLSSKLESAKKFKRWITSEILPSIRKTGSYTVQQKPSFNLPPTYAEALRELADTIEEKEKLLSENKAQSAKIAEDAPKVAAFDGFMATGSNIHIRTFVKNIQDQFPQVTEKWLFQNLRKAGILQSSESFKNQPYAEYGPKGRGYFVTKQSLFGETPLLTPKGQVWCHYKIAEYYGGQNKCDLFL